MCTPPLPWIVTGAVRPTRLWCLSRIPVDELFVTEAVGPRTMPPCASPKDTRSDVVSNSSPVLKTKRRALDAYARSICRIPVARDLVRAFEYQFAST